MEKPLINTLDFHLNPHSPSPNGISNQNDDASAKAEDIDMISFEMDYTSLKDLIPLSPPSTASPTGSMRDSWKEIPIKDPLVRNAAWAYLQPMVVARDEDERWWMLLKEKCCGIFGCINEVVLVVFYGFSPETDSDGHDEEDCKVN